MRNLLRGAAIIASAAIASLGLAASPSMATTMPPECSYQGFVLGAASSTYLHKDYAASKLYNDINVNSGFAPSNTRTPKNDFIARTGFQFVQGCISYFSRADSRNVTVHVAVYANGVACYYGSGVSGTDVSASESPFNTTASELRCGSY